MSLLLLIVSHVYTFYYNYLRPPLHSGACAHDYSLIPLLPVDLGPARGAASHVWFLYKF